MTNDLPKLVRDRIPEIIREDGKRAEVKRTDTAVPLIDKLLEEAREYHSSGEFEELVDVYEVIRTLVATQHEETLADLEVQANRKRRARGGFEEGYILYGVHE